MVKRILSNINLLNVGLILFILAFVHYKLIPRLNNEISLNQGVPHIKSALHESQFEEEKNEKLAPQEYAVISGMNLFHPDRHIVKYTPPPPAEVKLPPPDFVLHGTVTSSSLRLAFIEDRKAPFSTPGLGARHKTLKTGDIISGFTVKEIDIEKVVLVRNSEEIVLKKAPSQDKKSGGQQPFVRAPQRYSRSRYTQQRPQPVAPIAPALPPTIITVPAVPATPALTTPLPSAQKPIAAVPNPTSGGRTLKPVGKP